MLNVILKTLFMLFIWILTLVSFKLIDWVSDLLWRKSRYKKDGIKPKHRVRTLVSMIFGNTEDMSSEVFDDFCIQWGVSRDFLVFKRQINSLSEKDKEFLRKWENIWKGKMPKNSKELYDDK